jgi:Aspartyl protease/PDZ domain
MNKKSCLFALLLLTISFTSIQAITLDEVLKRHAEALGGIENLLNVTSFHYQADIKMGGLAGTAEFYYKKPDKIKLTADLNIIKIQQGLYNGRYWIKDQTGTMRDMAGIELQQFITEMFIGSYDYVLDKELQKHIEFIGETEFKGRNCYELLFKPPGGSKTQMYIDAGNFMPHGSFMKVQGIGVEVTYADWRIVNGVKMPFQTIQDMGNPLLLTTITTTGFEINEEIPDAVLRPPTSAEKSYAFADGKVTAFMPFTLNIHHIYIKVFVNGQGPFMFLLDSGAGMSIIGKHLADQLQLEDAGSMPAVGVGGIDVGNFVRVDSISLGDITLFDMTSGSLDLSFFNSIAVEPMDGILGYDLFSRLIVEVDYENSRLGIYDPETNSYPGGEDTLVCEIESNHPVVYGAVNDSIEGRFRFDTGSQNFLDLNSPMVKNNNLLDDVSKVIGSFPVIGVGGSTESKLAILKSFTIGKNRLVNVITGFYEDDNGIFSAENIDGNVGGGLLSWFIVGFDYPSNRVYLTRVVESQGDEGLLTSGIFLKKDGDGFEVFRIMPGTPAEDCGLQVGDKLVEIEKKKIKGLPLKDVYDMLNGQDGTKIWLKVEREGKNRKFRMKLKDLL